MGSEERRKRDEKAYVRWNNRRLAKYAAQRLDPAWIAQESAEGARDAAHHYGTGSEPDNVWTRQDPYAVAWRDATTAIMQRRLCK